MMWLYGVGRGAGAASRTLVWGLCAALAFSGLGVGLAGAAEEEGSLAITTDPAGARVFVDGRLKGVAPLTLEPIAAGTHRIKVYLKGYLENDREVLVEPGARTEIAVALTVGDSEAATPKVAEQTPPPAQPKGRSKKKLAVIAAVPVVLGAGAYALLSGGGAPDPGTISVSPTDLGMAEITEYTFTSQGTKPELTFDWDFGDGSTGQGQTVTHMYQKDGDYSVKLTVSRSGQDPVYPSGVTVKVAATLSGIFRGTMAGIGNAVALDIVQRPGRIQGQLYWEPPVDRSAAIFCMVPCKGNIAGTVKSSTYPTDVTFEGRVTDTMVFFTGRTVDGKTITGTTDWTLLSTPPKSGGGPTTLTRE